MSLGPRVFISYTTRSERSRTASADLVEALEAAGFRPWRDVERLRPGVEWHPELTKNLVTSHAGVLLLTREALASDFVLREATYLWTRAVATPACPLLCFLLDGLTPDALDDTPFGALQLHESQLVSLPADASPEALRAAVLDALAPVREDWTRNEPERRLLAGIADLLDVPRGSLQGLLDDLGGGDVEWFSTAEVERALRAEVARLMSCAAPPQVARCLRPALPQLERRARYVLDALQPFQAHPARARALAELASDPRAGLAGLNAEDSETARWHVDRAAGARGRWTVAQVTNVHGGDDEVAALRGSVRSAVAEALYLDADDPDFDADLADELEVMRRGGQALVVLVPHEVSAEALAAVRAECEGVTILLLWPTVDEAVAIAQLRLLAPPLEAGEEARRRKQLTRARRLLDKGLEEMGIG